MTRRASRLAGLVAAALAAATGLVGLSAESASAAVCSSTGISSVVDSGDGAGGGVATACDRTSGSKKAVAVFGATGVSMTRNPDGSVCKVNGRPAKANCGHLGSQYWGLWWSNGQGGGWTYSQQGVDTLTIPRNGSVAWAWQGPSGRRQPGVAPGKATTPSPTPTKTPRPKPTRTPKPAATPKPKASKPTATTASTKTPAAVSSSPTPTTRPARRATAPPSARASSASTASASPSATSSPSTSTTLERSDSASPEATTAQKVSSDFAPKEEHSGLPAWVPLSVILLLALTAFGGLWWRNRSGPA